MEDPLVTPAVPVAEPKAARLQTPTDAQTPPPTLSQLANELNS